MDHNRFSAAPLRDAGSIWLHLKLYRFKCNFMVGRSAGARHMVQYLALFESLELDQIRRGVLADEPAS